MAKKKQYVVVRANVAGVHAGELVSINEKTCSVLLKDSRRLWRVYTRDKSGSISDVVVNGLKEGADHSIGTAMPLLKIVNPPGLEIAYMTPKAWKSVSKYENK